MKHQYAGDINDYYKYGLLQILCGGGNIRLGVCWMLTPDDQGTDGSKIAYLDSPKDWRSYNPVLYDLLTACVKGSAERNVSLIESRCLAPDTLFYSDILTDSLNQRRLYFSDMRKRFANADLIFFDPDKGFEVQSVPCGKPGSSNYIYFREVSDVYRAGRSVLIYQHFPRQKRERFISTCAAALSDVSGAMEVLSFASAHAVFFLAAQAERSAYFQTVAAQVQNIWPDRFKVLCHSR